jgi:hypothetical protein
MTSVDRSVRALPIPAGGGNRTTPARVHAAMVRWPFVVVAVASASGPARADPAVRVGSRGGVELRDHADAYVGVDLRLSFPLSPLTINPTFDYVFDNKRTLYELSVNALYHLPVPLRRVDPYVGIGANVTSFSFKANTPGVDDNGNRLGMNLTAGACFDVPIVSPFVQVVKQIGEFDPISFGAGLVVALDGDDRWTGCGSRAR